FPVRGKRPATKNGFKDAVTDADQIRAWLEGHPELGIGCRTGEACGSWVLDVDGPHGREQLAKLEAHFGALPTTRRTKTRNGVHYWFAMPEGREIRIGTKILGMHPRVEALTRRLKGVDDEALEAQLKLQIAREEKRAGGGIDLRGTGGYVVLPPSPHPEGGFYALVDDAGVAEAPDWLVELVTADKQRRRALCPWLAAPSAPPPAKTSGVASRLWGQGDRSTPQDRARSRIEGMVREAVQAITAAVKGTRQTTCNDKCFALGGFLDEAGVSVDQVAPELEAAARAAGQNPEVVRRALEKGRQAPRPLPPDASPPTGGLPPSRPPDALNDPRPQRPQIVIGRRIALTTFKAIRALASHPDVYRQGPELYTVRAGALRPLSKHAIVTYLDLVADFVKLKKGPKPNAPPIPVDVQPPVSLAERIRDWGRYPEVRELRGVTRTPVLRPDGTILTTPGYDAATQLLYEPDGAPPRVPLEPKRQDAAQAVATLLDVVDEVPFAREVDRSVWLALILTLVSKSLLTENAPLFAAVGNQRRIGKTRLITYAELIALGTDSGATRWPNDRAQEELGKKIDAAVYEQKPLFTLDNVRGEIKGTALEAALTSPMYTLRVLSFSKVPTVAQNTVFAVTANGVRFGGDMGARTLPIRLFYPGPNPQNRTFRRSNLKQHIQAHRAELHVAALTIMSAYLLEGAPDQGLVTWGSYEAWSALVRNALVWAGQPDPYDATDGIEADDVADETHERLIAFIQATMATWQQDWTTS
ncbi:MAG: bifunctional DNA primase/polymerase, partial [Myxococcota bacterium]